jgi:hypothetical protein
MVGLIIGKQAKHEYDTNTRMSSSRQHIRAMPTDIRVFVILFVDGVFRLLMARELLNGLV